MAFARLVVCILHVYSEKDIGGLSNARSSFAHSDNSYR